MPAFNASYWDERYAEHESVWGAPPNRFVAEQLADLPPGRALDLACGEGRNATWLHQRGWDVIAVDFSSVAIEKGRTGEPAVTWTVADATSYAPPHPVDLVIVCYLQLPADERRAALTQATAALDSGGTLLVVAHHPRNIDGGTGGPQDPSVLYSPEDIAADLAGTDLEVEQASEVLRPVEGAERPAIDTLFRARRPTAP